MQIWTSFLQKLEERFGKKNVDTWARSLEIIRFDACNIYFQAKDSFQVLWVEEHVLPYAKEHLKNNNNHPIKLHLVSPEKSLKQKKASSTHFAQFVSDTTYTHCSLEQYVPSADNQLSFQIFCKYIGFNPETHTYIDPPQESFNPIFLYGPTGTGKTHLLMAAALFYTLQGKKVFFVSAETFTEHVVYAIRSNHMADFRKIYRMVDVLIVDDVQVFKRKNATQEEFFHTFNTLHTQGKQLILSSHVHPRLLELVEDRLISRFEWGITLPLKKVGAKVTHLQDIIKKRCHLYGIKLKKTLADFLLKSFPSPEALSKAIDLIVNHHPLSTPIIELSSVENILCDLSKTQKKESLTHEHVIDAVALLFGTTASEITGKSQSREITFPRQVCMYFLRKELKYTYMRIGDVFHRDHSTVISAIRLISKGLEEQDPDITYHVNQLQCSFAETT